MEWLNKQLTNFCSGICDIGDVCGVCEMGVHDTSQWGTWQNLPMGLPSSILDESCFASNLMLCHYCLGTSLGVSIL